MLLTVHHLYKGTYSFWVPREHVARVLDEYAAMEWFTYHAKSKPTKRRNEYDD